jgi:hypothetical protein
MSSGCCNVWSIGSCQLLPSHPEVPVERQAAAVASASRHSRNWRRTVQRVSNPALRRAARAATPPWTSTSMPVTGDGADAREPAGPKRPSDRLAKADVEGVIPDES